MDKGKMVEAVAQAVCCLTGCRMLAEVQCAGHAFAPEATAALAAIEAQGLMVVQGWRDIASAPRDGSLFLAARFTGAKRNHDGLMQVDRWHCRKRGDSYNGLGKFNEQFWPATHWMHLPASPFQFAQGKGE